MRSFLLCGAAVLLPPLALGQDQPAGHERAVAAIKRLGGEVKVDMAVAESPATVILTGAGRPAECLPYLKDVRNLRACDL